MILSDDACVYSDFMVLTVLSESLSDLDDQGPSFLLLRVMSFGPFEIFPGTGAFPGLKIDGRLIVLPVKLVQLHLKLRELTLQVQ
jgi:hypothetical protein